MIVVDVVYVITASYSALNARARRQKCFGYELMDFDAPHLSIS
jgi:hypothetical protein